MGYELSSRATPGKFGEWWLVGGAGKAGRLFDRQAISNQVEVTAEAERDGRGVCRPWKTGSAVLGYMLEVERSLDASGRGVELTSYFFPWVKIGLVEDYLFLQCFLRAFRRGCDWS